MASPIKTSFVFLLFLGTFLLTSCHVARYIFWNRADINDYKKFPADTLSHSPPVFTLFSTGNSIQPILPETYKTGKAVRDLDSFLDSKHTNVFLVVRHDSIIYERYFDGYDHQSVFPGFSITKSFISALTGIAVDEGYIKSIQQPVTDFLPEMKDEGFKKVTIEDLLSMRSGIRFTEGYSNPFSGVAKFYYGTNLRKYTLKLKVKTEPGESFKYQSANYQVLTMVLEKATGKRISDYLEEKIWQPAGMEFPGSWNFDSKKNREIKGFCCINARAVDFARFGDLYLKKGKLNNRQIIAQEWVDESLKKRFNSIDSQGFPYTYSWRVLPNGDFFAKGILGEYIYICPVKKIIIVRIGKRSDDIVWPLFFQDIIKQL